MTGVQTCALPIYSVAVALPLGGGAAPLSLDSSTLAVVEGAIDGGIELPLLRLLVVPGTESGLAGVIERFGRGHRAATLEVSVGPASAALEAPAETRSPDTSDPTARLSQA